MTYGLQGRRSRVWDFISESALRANIAYTLQSVQFDVLLVNRYNVFWTPLSMKYKSRTPALGSAGRWGYVATRTWTVDPE